MAFLIRLMVMLGLALTLTAALRPASPTAAGKTAPSPAQAAAGPVDPDVTSADQFRIGGIDVDVKGADPLRVRSTAFTLAQRQAWPRLWARHTGGDPASAPKLADGQIQAMVIGVDVEGEKVSANRYIGRLAVVFSERKASRYVGGAGGGRKSDPTLLIPILYEGGGRSGYDPGSLWYRVWDRFGAATSLGDYVRPRASLSDAILLNGNRAGLGQVDMLRQVIQRYEATEVVLMTARLTRLYPGGPIRGEFAAIYGLGAQPLGAFELQASNPTRLEAMLDVAVQRLDGLFSAAVRSGALRHGDFEAVLLPFDDSTTPRLGVVQLSNAVAVRVDTPDAQTLANWEQRLRAVRTVTAVSVNDLSLGGNSGLTIAHKDSTDWLLYELDQAGLHLAPTSSGLLLRPRRPDDPVIARPKTAEELAAEAAARAAAAQAPAGPATPAAQPAVRPRPAESAPPRPPAGARQGA